MNSILLNTQSNSRIIYYTPKIQSDNNLKQIPKKTLLSANSLEHLDSYNRFIVKRNADKNISFGSSRYKELTVSSIPNYSKTSNGGIRGESLSSRKNRKFLKLLKENGVNKIIDLRDKYSSQTYPELCQKYGFEYFNIPVDSSSVPDRAIIDNLPALFDIINGGNYYIACAQGLHRTDIALSLNYVFNPDAKEPPVLLGHYRSGGLKTEDISRRLNSIKKALTPEDIAKMGWDETFEKEFSQRKSNLYAYNRKVFNAGDNLQ